MDENNILVRGLDAIRNDEGYSEDIADKISEKIDNLDIVQELKYIYYLFLMYCRYNDENPNILCDLFDDETITIKSFIESNFGFYGWLKARTNIRGVQQELLLRNGVDIRDSKLIELYKGGYDTITSVDSKIVSPFSSTMNNKDSFIVRDSDNAYIVYVDGRREEIPSNSKILLIDWYTKRQLLYLLNTLAGIDITLYLVKSGIYQPQQRASDLSVVDKIMKSMTKDNNVKLSLVYDEEMGVYIDLFTLNMSDFKQVVMPESLMSEYELQYIQ